MLDVEIGDRTKIKFLVKFCKNGSKNQDHVRSSLWGQCCEENGNVQVWIKRFPYGTNSVLNGKRSGWSITRTDEIIAKKLSHYAQLKQN